MRGPHLLPTLLAALLGAAPVLPAAAETVAFTGTLSAQAEVPPHPGLPGSGTVEASFDTATRLLHYTVAYQGLTGPAAAAHFHGPADPGANAGVMIPVNGSLASPITGSATLTPDQAAALEAGKLYFNIHTPANKNGELRAQVRKSM